jgi:hypothetical protein
MSDPVSLQALALRIRATGALGRSHLIGKLFDFLVDCAMAGRAPKETEVAVEVFGKDTGFNVAQDAMVRVYVHKLRRKLEDFYAGQGRDDPFQLDIPKGAYLIVVIERSSSTLGNSPPGDTVAVSEISFPPLPPGKSRRRWAVPVLAVSLVVNLLLAYGLLWHFHGRAPADAVRATPLWSRMLDSGRPLWIVLGDYYIFAETDQNMEVRRLVREFSINSAGDLDQYLKVHPEFADRYEDMQLNYLPTSAAFALQDLLPLVGESHSTTRVVMASQLTPEMLRSSDVIYIGYLSGMGMLADLVFSGSRFRVGDSFDELLDRSSGKRYVSQAAMPVPGEQTYHDIGYFATFEGPSGNQIMIVAGTRDVAVRRMAQSITRGNSIQQLLARSGHQRSFEALYDVFAMNGTDLTGTLLLSGKIDTARIWADALGTPALPLARVPTGK